MCAAAISDAKGVLATTLAIKDPVRVLPTYQELNGKISPAIRSDKPRNTVATSKPTGAMVRNGDGPMDRTLQNTKIRGDRQPVQIRPEAGGSVNDRRNTGAVTRPVITGGENNDTPVRPETPTTRETRTTKQRDDVPRSGRGAAQRNAYDKTAR